jgi:hypothetical protein
MTFSERYFDALCEQLLEAVLAAAKPNHADFDANFIGFDALKRAMRLSKMAMDEVRIMGRYPLPGQWAAEEAVLARRKTRAA